MISFDEALALIAGEATPLGCEPVALEDANGRILAAPVVAAVSSPPRDMSAMDGYAVRSTDFSDGATRLPVVREVFAGTANAGKLEQGECARIFTGAPLPDGADRVVMQENVLRDGNDAEFTETPTGPAHIRKAGGDFGMGDTLLPAGHRLGFRSLTAAAAGDHSHVTCHRQLRVALLATGDELAAPGQSRSRAGAIPESISPGIAALVEDWGGTVLSRTRLQDDLPAMERAAREAVKEADLVIVTGGASVGDKDYARAMFAPSGLEMIFSKVAMKPGKPVWFARAGGTLVIGLPGNPTSALVTARLLLAPFLAGLAGGDPEEAQRWMALECARELGETGDREEFVRATLTANGRVRALSNQHSSAQHALASADVLIRRPANTPALAEGQLVDAIAF